MADQKTVEKDQADQTTGMTAFGVAFAKAGGVAEDFDGSPEALARASANGIQHMVARRKGGALGTLEDVERRVEEFRRQDALNRAEAVKVRKTAEEISREKVTALLAVIVEHEDDYVLLLEDLKMRKVLAAKLHRLGPEEEAYQRASKFLADVEFDRWDEGQQALLLNGVPAANSPELRQGLIAWLKEQEAKWQAKRQKDRNDENARRQQLRGLATANLHMAYSDRANAVHKVYVDGHYPAMRVDEAQRKLVPITRAEKGEDDTIRQVPVMTRGTFLLTVTDGGQYGQVLDEPVGMRMIKAVPHPDKLVFLNPGKNFRKEQVQWGQPQPPFFHYVVAEMLVAQWKREEEEITDTTIYDLLAGGEGRAMGYLPRFQSRDRVKVASIQFWVRGTGGRLYLTKVDSHTHKGYESFDFSGFPSNGISLEPEQGEPGFIRLVRVILRKMAERHRVLDKFETMKASNTVASMPEALKTGKAVYTVFLENWREGSRETGYKSGYIALQVENTGRGNMVAVDYFTTEPALDVPVRPGRIRVPVTLDLENGDEFQMRLQRMVRFAAGIRTPVASSNGTAVAETSTEVGEQAIGES